MKTLIIYTSQTGVTKRYAQWLADRLFGRAKQMEFIVFDNTSRENKLRKKNWDANLQKAYEFGKGFL